MRMDPVSLKKGLVQYVLITLGALIFSAGQLYFVKPRLIPMGGVSGLALLANYLWSSPVGLISLLLNIPLFLLGWHTMHRDVFCKSAFATVACALFLDNLAPFVPVFQGELLLAALYGGLSMGIGYGLIFRAGGVSGGTNIVAYWLNGRYDTPVGTVNLFFNIVVILLASFIYGDPNSTLYAIITSFFTSQVIDRMLYGMDAQKLALIITDHREQVAKALMHQLGRGVTAVSATGMYSGDERTVLLCAVRRHETGLLKRIVMLTDPKAFLLIATVSEVFGTNFKHLRL